MGEVEQVQAYRDVYHNRRRKEHLRREYLVHFKDSAAENDAWMTAEQFATPAWSLRITRDIARGAIECRAAVFRSH